MHVNLLPSYEMAGSKIVFECAETYALASVSGAHFNPAVTLAVGFPALAVSTSWSEGNEYRSARAGLVLL